MKKAVTEPDYTQVMLIDMDGMLAYYHPLRAFHINQAQAVAMSSWHLKHHLAHINLALAN